MEMAGKVVIVTGVSGGIGSAIASVLQDSGYIVAGFDIEEKLSSISSIVDFYKVDITEGAEIHAALVEIYAVHGRIDALINCAGILSVNSIFDETYEEWKRIINVNLDSVFLCSKEAIPFLSMNEVSHIINVSSVSGVKPARFSSVAYSASKAGIIGMGRTMALQLAEKGIRVNTIAPGFVDTDLLDVVSVERRQACIDSVPLGRMGLPSDIAGAVNYLLSDSASYITGETLHLNGGTYMA